MFKICFPIMASPFDIGRTLALFPEDLKTIYKPMVLSAINDFREKLEYLTPYLEILREANFRKNFTKGRICPKHEMSYPLKCTILRSPILLAVSLGPDGFIVYNVPRENVVDKVISELKNSSLTDSVIEEQPEAKPETRNELPSGKLKLSVVFQLTANTVEESLSDSQNISYCTVFQLFTLNKETSE